MNIKINVCGSEITLDALKEDVAAAKRQGYSNIFAFTPETVESLIEKVEELGNEIMTLRSVIRRG